MKFITIQDVPHNIIEVNGKYEHTNVLLHEVDVPFDESLGFKPLWAVPITTFKETMASLLTIAPNYPQMLYIFDSDDYVRVDKVKHYQNIMNDATEITPRADDVLPVFLCEYVVDRETITPDKIVFFNQIGVAGLMEKGEGSFLDTSFIFYKSLREHGTSDYIDRAMQIYVKNYPVFDFSHMRGRYESLGFSNIDLRIRLLRSWGIYEHIILPVIVGALTSDPNLEEGDYTFVWCSDFLESCAYNLNKICDITDHIAIWSYEDCSKDRYVELYNKLKDAIIDDRDALYMALDFRIYGEPGRNDECPCGSGKKYKKCHMKYFQ